VTPTDTILALEKALEAGPTRLPIASAPGYEADQTGVIWSVAHNWRGWGERALASHKDAHGYLRVSLVVGGKRIHRMAHALVCEAFHGPRPDGQEVRHLDGSRDNNAPSNLAWGTKSENAKDRIRHGTDKARVNGLLGAEATRKRFASTLISITCPVCLQPFNTRKTLVEQRLKRGCVHTCSVRCGRRTLFAARAAALDDNTKGAAE
jgi:hypothetical protein